ncbi:MAG: hypothetical protein ACRD72_09055, partial [Candidatus Angelobacter sp.]
MSALLFPNLLNVPINVPSSHHRALDHRYLSVQPPDPQVYRIYLHPSGGSLVFRSRAMTAISAIPAIGAL